MATPFMDIWHKLQSLGSKCTYGEVLLAAEAILASMPGRDGEEWRSKLTPHHLAALERWKYDDLFHELIKGTVRYELRRRLLVQNPELVASKPKNGAEAQKVLVVDGNGV